MAKYELLVHLRKTDETFIQAEIDATDIIDAIDMFHEDIEEALLEYAEEQFEMSVSSAEPDEDGEYEFIEL